MLAFKVPIQSSIFIAMASQSPIKQDVKKMSNWLTGCLSIPSQKTQPSPGFLDDSLRQSRL